ncbi:SgcJ/EcaC family oxidoreductase [Modestobacter sp. I12A-02628]|uniref:SgcJ/EcaC family oxidoreductase n=1 Tax=Goekera deserti TaxID=2497753 RepID=A0A7K3WDK1_9ACTN|nr:SgcJ/EcaC family oxidoreductase [Goekera deserti]MPQ96848.1 SgcJ/EcaC family oxidoreductase [Goekera deserti]NDI46838.1 SgcJ/EcaC family oxidoreductase [Goekera deserti]NEL54406.1 SgcJ/EcaC family oxidoreductase [Goekera deserti]
MSVAHPHHAHIRTLYEQYIAGWNRRSGATVAAGFADDGDIIAFDGTTHSGRLSIAADLRRVFAEHETPRYVAVVRSVRPITDGVAVLSAVAGMIPPGEEDVDPRLNFVHTLVAVDEGGRWRIAVLQATPARYYGQPDVSAALTEELQAAR